MRLSAGSRIRLVQSGRNPVSPPGEELGEELLYLAMTRCSCPAGHAEDLAWNGVREAVAPVERVMALAKLLAPLRACERVGLPILERQPFEHLTAEYKVRTEGSAAGQALRDSQGQGTTERERYSEREARPRTRPPKLWRRRMPRMWLWTSPRHLNAPSIWRSDSAKAGVPEPRKTDMHV